MQDSFEPQPSDNNSALPAPYNSPWKALGQDLRAVSADLRLRSQELWRRNREGDLSVPAFWPEPFAALFWPVLLGFGLAVLILGGIQLRQALQGQSPPAAPEVERVRTTPFPEARPLPISPSVDADPINPKESDAPAAADEPTPGVSDQELEATSVDTEEDKESDLLRFAPLLELLADEEGTESNPGLALIVSAQPQPERNAVTVQLDADAWRQRSPDQRQYLAETWWTRLEDQGYADLRLVNEQQDLLARPARIGGGMIVFDPKRV